MNFVFKYHLREKITTKKVLSIIMCLLDFLKNHVSHNLNFNSTFYTKCSKKTNSSSSDTNSKSLNLKQSSYYPEFMLLKNEDTETLSTSLQDGSSCTDFIYASGKCENFHCIQNHSHKSNGK